MAFAKTNPKPTKRDLGRTVATTTPIAIRSGISLPSGFEAVVRKRLATHLGHVATLIERGTVRFEDLNGPKGGVDTICRIKLVISGRPSLQVEKRGTSAGEALAFALQALKTTVARTTSKHKFSAGRRGGARAAGRVPAAMVDDGSLIGRRVGRGKDAVERALARPEKTKRDAYVDTAATGVSATAKKAGGGATARRNTRAKPSGATVTLEDSRTRPSRKSTRKSANRGKPSQGKERTAVARTTSPRAKAQRAIAQRRGR